MVKEAMTPRPECAQEALALLNCAAENPYDRDKCLALLEALRGCIAQKKDCKGGPYSIIDATSPNCKYHALNLGGWEGISPFPPLGYALVCLATIVILP